MKSQRHSIRPLVPERHEHDSQDDDQAPRRAREPWTREDFFRDLRKATRRLHEDDKPPRGTE